MRSRRSVRMLLLFALFLSVACGKAAAPYQKPLTSVRVQAAESHVAQDGVRYSASIEPNLRVDLAFKVGGYVDTIMEVRGRRLQEGDRVQRGDVLARVQEADYVTKVNQARSQLAEAEVALTQAEKVLQRTTALLAARGIVQQDQDAAQANRDAMAAKVAGGRALVTEAEAALANASVKAPISGVVLKRLIEAGSLVGPGSPAFVIADTSSVKVVFGAPDVRVQSLREGNVLKVTAEAFPGIEFRGPITGISPLADLRSRVFEVRITMPNPDERLKVGMVAAVTVPGDLRAAAQSSDEVVIPIGAVTRSLDSPDGYAVFVLDKTTGPPTVRRRNVTLGDTLGNRIVVTAGLKPGDQIVVSGAAFVSDREPVTVEG